jgi:L-glyceraldehyde 3-phosphate reductase
MGTPCLIHQPRYSMLDRWVEPELLDVLEQEGMGCIAFSPLAQGLLTNRYLKGIPEDSRAAKPHGFLTQEQITPDVLNKIQRLNKLAELRNQSLAQMAIAWLLKDKRITSVLVGASSSEQLRNSLQSLSNLNFSEDELKSIDIILND